MDTTIFSQINSALLPSAFIILLGALLIRLRPAGLTLVQSRSVISTLVLNLFYPALIFAVIPEVSLNSEMLDAALASNVGIAVGMLACWGLYPWLRKHGWGKPELAAMMLVCGLGNIISLGVPLLRAVQGNEGTRFAIYVDILAITPMLWIVGLWIAIQWGDHDEGRPGAIGFIRQLFKLPPIIAFVVSILLNLGGLELPNFMQTAARMLGDVTMSAMLLIVGMSLSFRAFRKHKFLAIIASMIKLILVPAIIYITAKVTTDDHETLQATVLLAAMPSMMATLIISERFGLNTELLSTVLVVSTGLFFLTLPGWLWLVG